MRFLVLIPVIATAAFAQRVTVTRLNISTLSIRGAPAQTNVSVPFSIDFASTMYPLAATNWAINGGGALTNSVIQPEILTDTNFSNSGIWTLPGDPAGFCTIAGNVLTINATNTYTSVQPLQGTGFRQFLPGFWYRTSAHLDTWASGNLFIGNNGQFQPPYSYDGVLWNAAGDYSASFPFLGAPQPSLSVFKIQTGNSPRGTGTVSYASLKLLPIARTTALVDVGITNMAAGVKLASVPANGLAGIVARYKPINYAVCIGDSKTGPSYPWVELMQSPVFGHRIVVESGQGCLTISNTFWTTTHDPANNSTNLVPDIAIINMGVNDEDGANDGVHDMITVSNSYLGTLFNITNLWPGTQCYLASVWAAGRSNTNVNNCVATFVATYPWCHAGPDERVWMQGSDNGVTMGQLHYTDTGSSTCATQWNYTIGNGNPRRIGCADGVYVYFNAMDAYVWAIEVAHGTNMLIGQWPVTYSANSLLSASVYTNMLKVFYAGTLLGTTNFIPEAELNGTNNACVGLFATEPGTSFSYFGVSNSTASTTAP